MPTVIVTGGAGFIGSHLAERFLREGWAVHIIDNLATGKRENIPANATFHELDIRDPKAAELVASLKPDVLTHLAAQMDVRRSVEDPMYDASVNVLGSLNLLEAARQGCPESPFVHMSTNKVYGDAPNRIALQELKTRWDYADPLYEHGIAESFSIDNQVQERSPIPFHPGALKYFKEKGIGG